MNITLYLATALIWGTTWIAIYWQVGTVDIIISIFYRFALAVILFFPLLILWGKLQRPCRRDHLFFLLQGACLFSLNFICFYTASQYIISGLLSVIFALATLFNAFNQWLIWRKRPANSIYPATALGVTGLVFLFWPELQQAHNSEHIMYGVGLSLLGTYLFSLGNMISVRHSQRGVTPYTGNAYGMLYGALILLVLVQWQGVTWNWDERPIYLASLLYLAIPGSIIGFTVYLALVGRIGANQAAYVTVLFPVVALTISTFVEGYHWDAVAVVGLILVLSGVLVSTCSSHIMSAWQRYRLLGKGL